MKATVKKRGFKTCFVPMCQNNTTKAPEKKFLHVPLDIEVKNTWFKSASRCLPESYKTNFYCCEDHFNLEQDTENYMKHKLTGCCIKLKEGVVPHIFYCQHGRKRTKSPPNPLIEELKRQRLVKEALEEYDQNISTLPETETLASLISGPTSINTLASTCYLPQKTLELNKNPTISIGIQVRPKFRSKGIICKPLVADKSLSPIKWIKTRDAATSPIQFIRTPTEDYEISELSTSSLEFDNKVINEKNEAICKPTRKQVQKDCQSDSIPILGIPELYESYYLQPDTPHHTSRDANSF